MQTNNFRAAKKDYKNADYNACVGRLAKIFNEFSGVIFFKLLTRMVEKPQLGYRHVFKTLKKFHDFTSTDIKFNRDLDSGKIFNMCLSTNADRVMPYLLNQYRLIVTHGDTLIRRQAFSGLLTKQCNTFEQFIMKRFRKSLKFYSQVWGERLHSIIEHKRKLCKSKEWHKMLNKQ